MATQATRQSSVKPKTQSNAQSAPSKKKRDGKKASSHVERVGGSFAYYAVLSAVAILVGLSIFMVVSAQSGELIIQQVELNAEQAAEQGKTPGLSATQTNLLSIALKHGVTILLGIGIAFALSRIDYRHLVKASFPAGVVIILLLAAVLIFGDKIYGAKRWILIAGQSLQPSEFAKPVLLVLLSFAFYRAKQIGAHALQDYRMWMLPAGIGAISIILIFSQPDMGTAVIIFSGLIVAYLVLELPLYSLFRGVIAMAGLIAGVIIAIPNRRERMLDFIAGLFKSGEVPYQTLQAKLAFGSGGFFGQGPGLSRQKYFYLPESQNDFILAIIAEELGLFGSFLVVGSFILLAWGGFKIAYAATDRLGRAIATGAVTMLLMQATLNIYSVIGLGPVTGKPLPFVTQGGSAMIGAFILLGLVLSVSRFGNGPSIKFAGAATIRSTTHVEVEPTRPVSAVKTRPERLSKTKRSSRNVRSQRITQEHARKSEDKDDEDNLEWRWDGGTHLPGSRPRR